MIGDTENFFELVKSIPSPVCILLLVPIILISAPFSQVYGAHDFPVFRMQQYDLNGVKYGSRSAAVNLEARSLTAENLVRRCAVVRASDLTINQLQKAIQDGLSAVLILLPRDLQEITGDSLEFYEMLENDLLEADLPIPVYFSHEDEELHNLYKEVAVSLNSDSATSALKALTTVASANSFHFVSDAGESKPLHDFPIVSIQGKLTGEGVEDQLATIAIVTHYDSFSIVPTLANGMDSTGSGLIAFMEISRLLSKLYDRSKTHPKYNILFLMAGGGKFNYQGTKKWIEDNIESSEISLLSEVDYVLCLDALGNGNELNLHVSKPPKDKSAAALLYQDLKQVSDEFFPSSQMNLIHKKVNLADDLLAWEHERFSLRRLPAGTVSHLSKPGKLNRGSIFDNSLNMTSLKRNTKIIAEGIARHVFNLTGKGYTKNAEVFSGDLAIDDDYMESWKEYLTSHPRSQQLIAKDSKLLVALEETMARYLKDVKRVTARADKKDPEYLFYDVFDAKINVYSVKPALFDLFLAAGIALYLGLVYLVIENFSTLTELLPKQTQNGKVVH